MTLKYRTYDIISEEKEAVEQKELVAQEEAVTPKKAVIQKEAATAAEPTAEIESVKPKPKRIGLLILLILGILLVLNIVYNVSVAEKGTPFLESVTTNSVFDLWGMTKKVPVLQKLTDESYGVVSGIFYSDDHSSAMVGGEIVHEGTVTSYGRIIKIYRNKVEFEKNGRTWKQGVSGQVK